MFINRGIVDGTADCRIFFLQMDAFAFSQDSYVTKVKRKFLNRVWRNFFSFVFCLRNLRKGKHDESFESRSHSCWSASGHIRLPLLHSRFLFRIYLHFFVEYTGRDVQSPGSNRVRFFGDYKIQGCNVWHSTTECQVLVLFILFKRRVWLSAIVKVDHHLVRLFLIPFLLQLF